MDRRRLSLPTILPALLSFLIIYNCLEHNHFNSCCNANRVHSWKSEPSLLIFFFILMIIYIVDRVINKKVGLFSVYLGSAFVQIISIGFRSGSCRGQVIWHRRSITLLLGEIAPCTSWRCVRGHCPLEWIMIQLKTSWMEQRVAAMVAMRLSVPSFCLRCKNPARQMNLFYLLLFLGSGFLAAIKAERPDSPVERCLLLELWYFSRL